MASGKAERDGRQLAHAQQQKPNKKRVSFAGCAEVVYVEEITEVSYHMDPPQCAGKGERERDTDSSCGAPEYDGLQKGRCPQGEVEGDTADDLQEFHALREVFETVERRRERRTVTPHLNCGPPVQLPSPGASGLWSRRMSEGREKKAEC